MQPLVALEGRKANVALFLSGGGSNARKILDRHLSLGNSSPVNPVALVTERLDDPFCGAHKLGRMFNLPVTGEDIRDFYKKRGCSSISLKTEKGREIRREWTDALREKLSGLNIDIGVFAGFETLTNITGDFCCLNVHPGDLTFLKNGKRYLVGLHTVPIERAIVEGLSSLRTSVIVATPYCGEGSDMDSGPVLGVSPPVSVDLHGQELDELRSVYKKRPPKRPRGGYGDVLESIAEKNQDNLKKEGDWIVFPEVVFSVARQQIAIDSSANVYYREKLTDTFRIAENPLFSG